jgi:hypothetical protein
MFPKDYNRAEKFELPSDIIAVAGSQNNPLFLCVCGVCCQQYKNI